jgi:hypothetical protein
MDPICSVTKNVMDGKASDYHLNYSHLNVNGKKVVCMVVIGDSAGNAVDATQSLQTFTIKWDDLKAKLPSFESVKFPADAGTWEFSGLTNPVWVHKASRAPRR